MHFSTLLWLLQAFAYLGMAMPAMEKRSTSRYVTAHYIVS